MFAYFFDTKAIYYVKFTSNNRQGNKNACHLILSVN